MNLFVTVNNSLINLTAISCAVLVDQNVVIKTMDGSEHPTEFTSLSEFQFFYEAALEGLMSGAAKIGIELGKKIGNELGF